MRVSKEFRYIYIIMLYIEPKTILSATVRGRNDDGTTATVMCVNA